MRIGIFGGSFNPIHNGHLKLAREAMSELNLSKVFFVPSCQTPLKPKHTLLAGPLRLKLLRAALKGLPGFSISLCEMKRKGPSFTVDTLRLFKKRWGDQAVLFFLSGADTLRNLPRWKSLSEVLRLCRFVVMTRPGYQAKKVPAPILLMPLEALPISASDIRLRLRHGKSVKGLVPAGVEKILVDYFKKNKGGLKSNRTKKLI